MAGFEREGLVKEKGLSLTPERMTDAQEVEAEEGRG